MADRKSVAPKKKAYKPIPREDPEDEGADERSETAATRTRASGSKPPASRAAAAASKRPPPKRPSKRPSNVPRNASAAPKRSAASKAPPQAPAAQSEVPPEVSLLAALEARRAPKGKPSPSRMMRAAELLKQTRRKTIEVELEWLEDEAPTEPREVVAERPSKRPKK